MVRLLKDRKGVSPVVGVMLMLIVTVILAAAVNAYTNSVSVKETTPIAQFDAKASYSSGNITLDMISGDTLYKDDIAIKIETSHPLTSGYVDMSKVVFVPHKTYASPGDTIIIPCKDGTPAGTSLWIGKGQPFTVTIIDKDTGNPIWTGHLVMNP